MSKKYLNILKNLKIDQFYAHEELDVNNWSQWDPNKYLIDTKIIKKMSKQDWIALGSKPIDLFVVVVEVS